MPIAGVMYNDTSKVLICGVGGVGGAARAALNPAGSGTNIISCDPNYNIGQIGLITRWTPVKNLTFSADAYLHHAGSEHGGYGIGSVHHYWQASSHLRAQGPEHGSPAPACSAQLVIQFV